jgi:hypothetical protein
VRADGRLILRDVGERLEVSELHRDGIAEVSRHRLFATPRCTGVTIFSVTHVQLRSVRGPPADMPGELSRADAPTCNEMSMTHWMIQ